jgi:hypothetical protein
MVCIKAGKDKCDIIEKQMKKYKKEKYPMHKGLIENTVILRRHNMPEVVSLGEAWWLEIKQFSKRDQLSFSYVAWKQNFHYMPIDGFLWDIKRLKYNNKLFGVESHTVIKS